MEKSKRCDEAEENVQASVDEEKYQDESVEQPAIMNMDIKSTAVVKYSAVQAPAQFYKLQSNTNLNLPPDNWLRESDRWQVLKGNWTSTGTSSAIFSSLHMANIFPDCVGEVDVVSDAENIKRLLKIPYSKSPVSMMVHRIGKTLLLDDFDIHQHLLQAAKKEWEWLRKFFLEQIFHTLQHKNQACFRRNKSRGYLQHKNMLSKFLYYSLADTGDCLVRDGRSENRQTAHSSHRIPATSINSTQTFPAEESETSSQFHDYQRNVLWTFEDIRMLIGTDMPIFGGGTHPCVSLRLRDITKPINVLTGLDYWLDNLMCNVPEVMMCYHLDGIVQKYELIKTEDIPQMDNSRFSPKVIKDIAQNILSFLKSNATKAGHTYWLFKAKDDEVVKLYDLTNLCADIMDDKEQNPFTVPVAMLLYRVAQNMKAARPNKSQQDIIFTLLKNCLTLLDEKRHPQVTTSANYLLSDLYVPSTIDVSSLDIPTECDSDGESEDDDDDDSSVPVTARKNDCDSAELQNLVKESLGNSSSSVSIKALCLPEKFKYNYSSKTIMNRILSGSLEDRCKSSLYHVEQGLNCLQYGLGENLDPDEKSEVHATKNQEDIQERAKPFQPIPLHYEPLNPQNTSSLTNKQAPVCTSQNTDDHSTHIFESYNEKNMPVAPKTSRWLSPGSWQSFYMGLLFQKATLAAYALAQSLSDSRQGEALRFLKLALACYGVADQVVSSVCQSKSDRALLGCCIFGLAGDLHFMIVQNSAKISELKEQYEQFSQYESIMSFAGNMLSGQCCYEWASEIQVKIEDMLILSSNCYQAALERAYNDEEKVRLRKRIGNIQNELGVFYMSQAHSIFKETGEISDHVQNLWKSSAQCLEMGAHIFDDVEDYANIALLNSNLGRLMRLQAVCCSQKDGPKELTVKEWQFYDKAISFYKKALRYLTDKNEYSGIKESITWDLSTTYFTVASLMQDYAPLSIKPCEEIEKDISEYMLQALKHCDMETTGAKQPIYQYRAAVIHHRLGSLNHHLYRNLVADDVRKKQYRTLAEMHLSKAANLLCLLEDCAEYLRVQLERIGLGESHFAGLLGNSAKVKCLHTQLELIFEAIPVISVIRDQRAKKQLNQLVKKCSIKSEENMSSEEAFVGLDDCSGTDDVPFEQINNLLSLLQQRLQFSLLNLVKIFSSKLKKGNDALAMDYKKMYNESLQLSRIADPFCINTYLNSLLSIHAIFLRFRH